MGTDQSGATGRGFFLPGLAEVTSLSVVGRVRECLTQDGQQFEHFTQNVINKRTHL